jgi:hypothetical protein
MVGANYIQQTAEALQQQWDIQLPNIISEETILKQLTNRVIYYLEKGPEAFFQLMYRLDISEKKLNGVMNEEDVAAKIARLIFDRQLQKIQSRQAYKKEHSTEDPELKW